MDNVNIGDTPVDDIRVGSDSFECVYIGNELIVCRVESVRTLLYTFSPDSNGWKVTDTGNVVVNSRNIKDGEVYSSAHVYLGTGQSISVPLIIGETKAIIYFDYDARSFIFIEPAGDTFSITDSCSQILRLNVIPVIADMDYLNINPNTLHEMVDGIIHSGLSFDIEDMRDGAMYCPCTDIGNGEYISNVFDGLPPVEENLLSDWNQTVTPPTNGIITYDIDTPLEMTLNVDTIGDAHDTPRFTHNYTNDLIIGETYRYSFDYTVTGEDYYFKHNVNGGYGNDIPLLLGTHSWSVEEEATSADIGFRLWFNTETLSGISIVNMKVEKV